MNEERALEDLKAISGIIERSNKFLSLSGLAGVLAGIYALIGAWYGNYILNQHFSEEADFFNSYVDDWQTVMSELIYTGIAVLVLSLISAVVLSLWKMKRTGESPWSRIAWKMLRQMGIVLLSGGVVILVFIQHGFVGLIVPMALIFYGVALIVGSRYTRVELEQFGTVLLLLGLAGLFLPEWSILLWCIGFGVGHIFYGVLLYIRYERKKK